LGQLATCTSRFEKLFSEYHSLDIHLP
jgi:hypothetical protein